MQRMKTMALTLAFTGLATAGLGSASAFASTAATPAFYVSGASAGDPPEPAYDPCPDGYLGVIVGYDDSNGTGKRVYACYKTHP